MAPQTTSMLLIVLGMLLLLLGLLSGLVVNVHTNPRMGLAAHVVGVQNGMLLILFGLIWAKAQFSQISSATNFGLVIYSLYGLWIALVLAGIWGTSSATPIAGAGYSGAPWQETTVRILLLSTSLTMIVATVWLLVRLALGLKGSH